MKEERLEWDSTFFKLNISKVFSEKTILFKKDFTFNETDLFYLFSDIKQPKLEDENVFLADIKITYHKKVIPSTTILDEGVTVFSGDISEDLYQLGISSGWSSRFNVDPKLNNKFVDLYRLWVLNSVNHKIADEVFVLKDESKFIGLITLKKNNKIGKIGIISIDSNYRGKNLGSKLLTAANYWYYRSGITHAEVVTQKANIGACKFYERNGYSIKNIEYIYHVWR